MKNGIVVDADAHILEPVDLWQNYLEEKYQDRAIKWKVIDEGLEYFAVEGRPAVNTDYVINGALGGVGGYPELDGDRTRLMPDEKTTPAMVELLGEDRFIWASDFPHVDAEYGVVAELKENIASLPEGAQRKLLGENAVEVYRLD